MSEQSEWMEQLSAELQKQASERVAKLESLILVGDFDAMLDWVREWEIEDQAKDSLFQRYRQARKQFRLERANQRMASYAQTLRKITKSHHQELEQ